MPSPFQDHAAPVLAGDPALTDEKRASLWDVFHNTKDHNELAQQLQPMTDVPEDTKHQLYLAKQQAGTTSAVPTAPADTVSSALAKMVELSKSNPEALDLAESHPAVLKTIVAAMAQSSTKGGEDEKKKKLQLPARTDGMEHLPEIPEGHRRVTASDGGIHDIPDANIQRAMLIDPKLHIMNP